MRHVQIRILTEDLPRASLTLAATGTFHPDYRAIKDHPLPDIPGERYRQLFQQAQSRLEKIVAHFPDKPLANPGDLRVVTERELDAVNNRLGQLWQESSALQEEIRRYDEQARLVGQLQRGLDRFTNLPIDLRLVQGEKTFLDLHIGLVPHANLARMEEALGLAGFLVYPFLVSDNNAYVVIVGPKGASTEHVKTVLEAAAFNALPIPPELRDDPATVAQRLAERRASITAERDVVQARITRRSAETTAFIRQAMTTLALAEPYVSLGSAARCSQQLAMISGWVPARAVKRLNAALEQALEHPFMLASRTPQADERPEVPTLLLPNRLLSPFTALVNQYGIPRYGEIDPSAIFAVTFVLMFGMMFGDVGHGGIIMLSALALPKRFGRFVPFISLAGMASVGFGFLYGSFFGYENLLAPLWMSPLSNPLLVLKIALGWGVGYLLLMGVLRIYNRVTENEWLAAIFDTGGLMNLALYLGLLWGGYHLGTGEGFGLLAALVSMVSLLALAGFKWYATSAQWGERIMVVVVEIFEVIIGNVSKTLSFLRIAAFSFNHVALALAIFTLAEVMSPTGHWITVVLGNLFILVLEGAIVGIQVLRLEYYEGFTRFYSGDGREFRPLTLTQELRPSAGIA